MKPPKNFYSNLDRRKQGLENGIPDIPTPSAEDAGKVIKVGSDGEYELGADIGLPEVTSTDARKMLQVTTDGKWTLRPLYSFLNVITDGNGTLTTSRELGARITSSGSTISRFLMGQARSFVLIVDDIQKGCYIRIEDNGVNYSGIVVSSSADGIIYIVFDSNGVIYKAVNTSSDLTITKIGFNEYIEITASGSSVSLPSGVTFADVYALLQAGVEVKFTSGARVYSVTSFESTNIRAHWISDLDLTNIEVYVINLASDGTGTVASATFSGT